MEHSVSGALFVTANSLPFRGTHHGTGRMSKRHASNNNNFRQIARGGRTAPAAEDLARVSGSPRKRHIPIPNQEHPQVHVHHSARGM
jgi:hypothetical protein